MTAATIDELPEEDSNFVVALARGLSVMRAFSSAEPRMTVADIAKAVDLPRATVRRSLITLRRLGYVDSDGRLFSLSPKVLSFGTTYLSASPLPKAVQPLLERFADSTRESAWAAILDDDEALLVAGAKSNRLLAAGLSVGCRLPAACSALGRVLLAGLPDHELEAYYSRYAPRVYTQRTITDLALVRDAVAEVRSSGYAIVDSEVEFGLCSIAVPIRSPRGKTIASLNATAPSGRVSKSDMIERFLPLLQQMSLDIRPALS